MVVYNPLNIAREDIDSIMLAVRHMETRILDRMEELSARIDKVSEQVELATPNGAIKAKPAAASKARGAVRNRRNPKAAEPKE